MIVKLKRIGPGTFVDDSRMSMFRCRRARRPPMLMPQSPSNYRRGHRQLPGKAMRLSTISASARATADIHIELLEGWGDLFAEARARCPMLPMSRVAAMDIGEARVVVTYVGNLDQLHDNMPKGWLRITNDGWRLDDRACGTPTINPAASPPQ